jgi:AraC-like DNA-binding protein
MEAEYKNNQDEFSKDIILSHLESLLSYAQRFYKRQFIDRKPIASELLSKFDNAVEQYYQSGAAQKQGLPEVQMIASDLHVSPKYLSDLLKQETGKTAIEHIHLNVISKAKHLLLLGQKNVSQVAYSLGFQNTPYFTRLFKREVGVTPTEYISRQPS